MSDLEQLARDIAALSPPAALRLAADLLERKKPELAYTIIDRVRLELGAVLARALVKKRGTP